MTELTWLIEKIQSEIEKLDCSEICPEHKLTLSHTLTYLFFCEKCLWSKFPATEKIFSKARKVRIDRHFKNEKIMNHVRYMENKIRHFSDGLRKEAAKFKVILNFCDIKRIQILV